MEPTCIPDSVPPMQQGYTKRTSFWRVAQVRCTDRCVWADYAAQAGGREVIPGGRWCPGLRVPQGAHEQQAKERH
eukprot:492137-Pelagomonas_calceolata.AAC.10